MDNWKGKAIERRHENKALKKRAKELIISRENWKTKAMAEKRRKNMFEKELNKIKKKLNKIIGL